ncbi:hypothetical protein FIBSPDRAFT_730844 [Athelia psychrophila]|uniref:Regulator of volume decrease after cellular swelling-domain-containing protein n=1 Tax=Athelia psychrophila TaxID=1759441 RepID=A0A166QQC3_9AGAM|nr:hypothetical protein FIBSPDRAFT_730844 [Fibularhizoctonia sp. CBS 109695]
MPAATFITSLPRHAEAEEHRILVGSTPASFNDIPPKLCHKEENVSVTLDPPLKEFSSEDGANGTLYVIESFLVFMGPSGRGFQIPYPAITLHAVSRAASGPSIYCQLDDTVGEAVPAATTEDTIEMRELTVIPQNQASLDPIFEALSQCAALHPDPTNSDDEEMEGGDAWNNSNGADFEVFNGDDGEELSEVGRVRSDFLTDARFKPY